MSLFSVLSCGGGGRGRLIGGLVVGSDGNGGEGGGGGGGQGGGAGDGGAGGSRSLGK